MKKKKLFMGMAAILLALFAAGCPQETEDSPAVPSGDGLVSAIRIGGVSVSPLPQAGLSIDAAAAVSVVVNVERPPKDTEQADGVYYNMVRDIEVALANANETVYFEVTAPDALPEVIELPSSAKAGVKVSRAMGIALPDTNKFPVGQTVWLRVVAADESKTNYYKINVVSQTHDTALTAITFNGKDALDVTQSPHIGHWQGGASWANAAASLANLTAAEAASVAVAVTPRNIQFDLSKQKLEYAKIPAASAANAPEPAWSAAIPASFENHDILAVRITASNGTTQGYLKITVNVGGSPFLSSLTVNDVAIGLGSPSDDIATVGGAYRVEEGQTLSGTAATWAVAPVADDSNATVSWALAAKRVIPQDGDFTSPTSFDTSHNYLFIKVVSATGEFTKYYLVVFDERPKTVEHVKTGSKCVPMYRFAIPDGHTWAEMGTYPKVRMTVLQEEYQFNRVDGYQRNFVFGEASKFPQWNATSGPNNLTVGTGGIAPGVSWAVFMPLIINKQLSAWAVAGSTPAAGIWYTIEYPLAVPDDESSGIKKPWNSTEDLVSTQGYQRENYWPDNTKTGDVYFGIGITHDEQKEYWIKELALVSEDGSLVIPCNLYDAENDQSGNGRIDSTNRNTGFVLTENQSGISYLREMVADPTLR
ncbi:MAG: hypothetical protein LBD48_08870 [Treponema sp.]|nr:hypothetical protein [Treponema sp.]